MAIDITKPNTNQTIGEVIDSTRANIQDLDTRVQTREATQTTLDSLVVTQTAYNAHAADQDAHGLATVRTDATSVRTEVQSARGSKTTLTNRLNVSLTADGAIRLSQIAARWIDNADTPTYVSTTSFTVPGDRTGVYIPGALLRFLVSGTYAYGNVASRSFGGGVTTVTLDPAYPVLTVGLTQVNIALVSWDNSIIVQLTQAQTDIIGMQGQINALKIERLAAFKNGAPASSEVVLRAIATRAFTVPIDAAGSQMTAGIAATASTTFDLARNGTNFGTVQFAAAGTIATWTVASATAFAAGDILTIVAPASPDATLANLVWAIAGNL